MAWIVQYLLPFILILGILVFVHEFGHFFVARRNGVRVTVFSIGFGPELFGFTDKYQTRWRWSLIPLGGYVKMLGDADPSSARADTAVADMSEEDKQQTLFSKTPLQRIAVSIAGPAANYLLSFFLIVFLMVVTGVPSWAPQLGTVDPEMIAGKSDLRSGDVIEAFNDETVDDFDQLRRLIKKYAGTDVVLKIRRAEQALEKKISMYEVEPATQEKKPIARLGVTPGGPLTYKKQSLSGAIIGAATICWTMSVDTLKGIGAMIMRQKGSGEMGGILSIGDMAAQSTQNGFASMIWFMAVLSINLGLINLLPIPVLDGGHILLCTIEAVRGRPLTERVQDLIFTIGFVIVASLMLYATWSDIVRYKLIHTLLSWF